MSNSSVYLSASNFPIKLVKHIQEGRLYDKIRPLHLQYYPTNRCNLRCKYCSCDNRDKNLEMLLSEAIEMINYFQRLGTKAITLSGGGDPLMWGCLEPFLVECKRLGIEIGIVSAYYKHESYSKMLNNYITWSRMSITDKHVDVEQIIKFMPDVDVGFSYVVRNPDIEYLDSIIELSEKSDNVTHIRFTHDIMDNSEWGYMGYFEDRYKENTKCLFQPRSEYNRGMHTCYISKLKPLVDAKGDVYPCCGVQYAQEDNDARDLSPEFKMCNWIDFHNSDFFNGSSCSRCYYNHYNELLNIINKKNIKHLNFL